MAVIGLDKFSLFTFILIYIFIIGGVVAIFSNSGTNTLTDDFGMSGMQDQHPNSGGIWDLLNVASAFWNLLVSALSIFWNILTLQIPFIPQWLGFLLAIPVYIWLLVLIDYILVFIPIAIDIYKAMLKTVQGWFGG